MIKTQTGLRNRDVRRRKRHPLLAGTVRGVCVVELSFTPVTPRSGSKSTPITLHYRLHTTPPALMEIAAPGRLSPLHVVFIDWSGREVRRFNEMPMGKDLPRSVLRLVAGPPHARAHRPINLLRPKLGTIATTAHFSQRLRSMGAPCLNAQ